MSFPVVGMVYMSKNIFIKLGFKKTIGSRLEIEGQYELKGKSGTLTLSIGEHMVCLYVLDFNKIIIDHFYYENVEDILWLISHSGAAWFGFVHPTNVEILKVVREVSAKHLLTD